jgi:hypothetical protein
MSYFGRVTLVYLGGIVLCGVLLFLLAYVSQAYLDVAIPTNATSVVGLIVPAMMAGMTFVKRLGTRPLAREMWGLSLWFAIIQMVIGVVVLSAMGFFQLPEFVEMTQGESFLIGALIVMVVFFVVLVLVSRLGLGIGVRQGVKQLSRFAAS